MAWEEPSLVVATADNGSLPKFEFIKESRRVREAFGVCVRVCFFSPRNQKLKIDSRIANYRKAVGILLAQRFVSVVADKLQKKNEKEKKQSIRRFFNAGHRQEKVSKEKKRTLFRAEKKTEVDGARPGVHETKQNERVFFFCFPVLGILFIAMRMGKKRIINNFKKSLAVAGRLSLVRAALWNELERRRRATTV